MQVSYDNDDTDESHDADTANVHTGIDFTYGKLTKCSLNCNVKRYDRNNYHQQ